MQDRWEIPGQALQQYPLLMAVEEDEMDWCRVPALPLLAGRSQFDHGIHQIQSPVNE